MDYSIKSIVGHYFASPDCANQDLGVALLSDFKDSEVIAYLKNSDLPALFCNLIWAKAMEEASLSALYFAPAMKYLKRLKWLHLSNNQIATLPAEIAGMKGLEWLDLSNNQISTLPAEIAALKRLEWLNLGKNPITLTEQERIKKMMPNCNIIF